MSEYRIVDDTGLRLLTLAAIAGAVEVIRGVGRGELDTSLEAARLEAEWLEAEGAIWLDAVTGEGERGAPDLARRARELLAARERGEIAPRLRRGGRSRVLSAAPRAQGWQQAPLFESWKQGAKA